MTIVARRRHRLGGHHVRVSGPRHARLAAAAAARHPDLHRGLRLRRYSRRARARAIGAARDLRLALRRRLLVPERSLARRRDLRHRLRALSLRLSRRARDVPDARLRCSRRPPACWARGRGARAPHHAAAGAARHRGRACARAARDAQRHRRQRISRRADADAVDLHHLAQPRQPRWRGADGLPHAADRRRADRARTLRPTPRRRRALRAGRAPCRPASR